MDILEDLEAIATEIKAETEVGANTAAKVGGLIQTLISRLRLELYSEPLIFTETEEIALSAYQRFCLIEQATNGARLPLSSGCIGRKITLNNDTGTELEVKVTSGDYINLGEESVSMPIDTCFTFMAANAGKWIIVSN
ncbi:MAG: hypothetical protein ACOYMF_17975 [Bacteroidales bacterium]